MEKLCKYGTHRVIYPLGALPQSADKLDNNMVCMDNEILIQVKTLNIDSASFTQIKGAANSDIDEMKEMILSIVNQRGKMQNPVTGSGGMLLGTVKEVGKDVKKDVKAGDEIASLVSLSLTPLKISKILAIHLEKDQVDIEGEAILFETGIFAKIPDDMPPHIALAALDVAGAPAQVKSLVKKDDTVVILGCAGKSGVLCAYQARKSAGPNGKIIGIIHHDTHQAELESLKVCDHILIGDAKRPMEIYEKVMNLTNNEGSDVTINVVNVQNTEMATILPTKSTGTVYFFSMATSFTKAALGAEGIASEALMIIGNGYTRNHAKITLDILRESKEMFELFQNRYGKE
ncbi:L-erythro-3,5-diaminohexanoate dehydrogenase [Mycoplasmatota bacterium WC30]